MGADIESRPLVLIVDDERSNRAVLAAALGQDASWELLLVEDGYRAQEVLERREVDVVVTDLMMPGLDGLSLMRWAREHAPGPAWIIHSALDTFEAAVEALQLGAFDFVPKPLRSVRLIQSSVRNAVTQRRLLKERDRLQNDLEHSNARLRDHVSELDIACRMLSRQAELIEQDLKRAERIQRTLLPSTPPSLAGYSVDSVYRPSRSVGGDLYGVVRLDDAHVALYVADAAGHGVAAAMLAVLVHSALLPLDASSRAPRAPAAVLADLDRAVGEHSASPGLFVTMAYAVLDERRGELCYASAGHPPARAQRASGGVEWVERTGPALGLGAGAAFGERMISLGVGDQILLYTDGLIEGDDGAPDAHASIWSAVEGDGSGAPALQALLEQSSALRGGAPNEDDLTMLLLTRGEGVSTLDNGLSVDRPSAPPLPAESQTSACVREATEAAVTFLALSGRCTWGIAAGVHAVATGALREGRDVVIDLDACVMLDSTCLGTLHEIVMAGEGTARNVTIQGVSTAIAQLFDELSMQRVMDAVARSSESLPARMQPIERESDGPLADPRRILRAHETLRSLSERNRAEFGDLVEALRAEVGDDKPA